MAAYRGLMFQTRQCFYKYAKMLNGGANRRATIIYGLVFSVALFWMGLAIGFYMPRPGDGAYRTSALNEAPRFPFFGNPSDRYDENISFAPGKPTFKGKLFYIYDEEFVFNKTGLQLFPQECRRTLRCQYGECQSLASTGYTTTAWDYMFDLDSFVALFLYLHPQRTEDPKLADLFFVPQVATCIAHDRLRRAWKAGLKATARQTNEGYLRPILDAVVATPQWNNCKGCDHVFLWPHGISLFPGIGGPLKNTISLQHRRSRSGDIIIPGLSRLGPAVPPSLDREHLMMFRGYVTSEFKYSMGVRQALSALYPGNDPHPGVVTSGLPGNVIFGSRSPNYRQEAQNSLFLLCPDGWAPWSPRPFDALAAGAVPAIISDTIVLPGEPWLDWSAFSVRIGNERARNDQTEPILRNVSLSELREKQANVREVSKFLLWDNPYLVLDWVFGQALLQAERKKEE